MKSTHQQPWISSAIFDLFWFVGPPLLVSLIVLCFPNFFHSHSDVSPIMWLILIVGVDVAHVYSTLYRTYFDSSDFHQNAALYKTIPIACWIIGVMLYSIHALLFWSILAYLAVFHFIRQQYGFMMIYARASKPQKWEKTLDQLAIYFATLYPVIYWHTHSRDFHWFIDGDFLTLPLQLQVIAKWIYIFILIAYFLKEIRNSIQNRFFNLPKNLILIGSAASWYIGIVLYNADFAFTFTNVLAHGIPYMALIWLYGHKKWKSKPKAKLSYFFRPALLGAFILVLLFFAYVEEGLWDGLIWKEHATFFPILNWLPSIHEPTTLAWIVPLLAMPQATHYVLDGFIWRFRKGNQEAKQILFGNVR